MIMRSATAVRVSGSCTLTGFFQCCCLRDQYRNWPLPVAMATGQYAAIGSATEARQWTSENVFLQQYRFAS